MIGLQRLVDNHQRYTETERLEIAHLLRDRDDTGVEVDREDKRRRTLATLEIDVEHVARRPRLELLHVVGPLLKENLRVELLAKALTVVVELFATALLLPAFAKNVFDSLQIPTNQSVLTAETMRCCVSDRSSSRCSSL